MPPILTKHTTKHKQMKTPLHAAAIFAALSATVVAGCGGGNPQEEAEKAVMAFVTAAGNGDFKTADELAYCADSNEAQTWAAVKVLSKKYETASDEELKNLPPMPILACDFEVLHADALDTVLSAYDPMKDEDSKAELALNDITDVRVVPLKFTFRQRWAKLNEHSKHVGFILAVKQKGKWKSTVQLNPLDVDLEDLK